MPLVSKTFSQIITFTRASTATFFDSAGVLQSAAIDAPRFDYDPSTLAAQGFLIEESRTNSIRNNTMVGAVAGTPGTLPTNWTVAVPSGLTTNVVGTGTFAGISYVDLQITGTPNSTAYVFQFDGSGVIGAAASQTWTISSWFAQAAGSQTNITGIQLRMRTYTSGFAFIGQSDSSSLVITSALARSSHNYASLPATTAFIEPAIRIGLTVGAAIDITLRIGLPQLELGAFATSVIPTTTTALTRAADVASVNTLSPWYNAVSGTLYAESVLAGNAISKEVAQFNDGTIGNSVQIRWASGSQAQAAVSVGGVNQASIAPSGYSTVGTIYKRAFAFAVNDFEQAINGISVGTDTSGSIPAVTTLMFSSATGSNLLCGYLRRITYYPRRLSNAELVSITS
jgi:hypothetical protein